MSLEYVRIEERHWGPEVSERVAVFTLADTLASLGNIRGPGNYTNRGSYDGYIARTRVRLPDDRVPVVMPWTLPWGLELLDHTQIATRWQLALDTLGAEETRRDSVADLAARSFVRFVLELELGMYAIPGGRGDFSPPDWSALLDHAKRLLHCTIVSRRTVAFQEWIQRHLLLLATPESGLPSKAVRELIDAWNAHLRPADAAQALEEVHKNRLTRALVALADTVGMKDVELLSWIDSQSAGHPWHALDAERLGRRDGRVQYRFVHAMQSAQLIPSEQRDFFLNAVLRLPSGCDELLEELTRCARSIHTPSTEYAILAASLWKEATTRTGWIEGVKPPFVRVDRELRPNFPGSVVSHEECEGDRRTIDRVLVRKLIRHYLGRRGHRIDPLLELFVWSWWDLFTRYPAEYGPVRRRFRWTRTIVHVHYGIEVPWMAPQYWTFADERKGTERWNHAVDSVMQPREFDRSPEEASEDLVLHYAAELGAANRQGNAPAVTAKLEWVVREAMSSNFIRGDRATPEENGVAKNVRIGICLLVTPESGLGVSIRTRVLDVLRGFLGDSPRNPDVAILEQHRLRRIRVALKWAGRSPAEAPSLLAQWDAAEPPTHWNALLDHLRTLHPSPAP